MRAVIERSLEALATARTEVAQARKRIALSMALLFLVHLLTVFPYLKIQTSSLQLESELSARQSLLDEFDSSVQALGESSNRTTQKLREAFGQAPKE